MALDELQNLIAGSQAINAGKLSKKNGLSLGWLKTPVWRG